MPRKITDERVWRSVLAHYLAVGKSATAEDIGIRTGTSAGVVRRWLDAKNWRVGGTELADGWVDSRLVDALVPTSKALRHALNTACTMLDAVVDPSLVMNSIAEREK